MRSSLESGSKALRPPIGDDGLAGRTHRRSITLVRRHAVHRGRDCIDIERIEGKAIAPLLNQIARAAATPETSTGRPAAIASLTTRPHWSVSARQNERPGQAIILREHLITLGANEVHRAAKSSRGDNSLRFRSVGPALQLPYPTAHQGRPHGTWRRLRQVGECSSSLLDGHSTGSSAPASRVQFVAVTRSRGRELHDERSNHCPPHRSQGRHARAASPVLQHIPLVSFRRRKLSLPSS